MKENVKANRDKVKNALKSVYEENKNDPEIFLHAVSDGIIDYMFFLIEEIKSEGKGGIEIEQLLYKRMIGIGKEMGKFTGVCSFFFGDANGKQ